MHKAYSRVPHNRPLPIVNFWIFFQPPPPPPPLLIFENFKSEIETFSQRLLSFTPKRVKVGWLFPHHLFLSRVKKEEIALPQMFSKTELFSFLKIVTQI